MSEVRNGASNVCIAIAVAGELFVGIWYRFGHPELTETQLFLNLWPAILGFIVLILLAGALRTR